MKSLKLFIATLIVLLGDKIALAQLDDACEVYEAFEEVETAPVASKSSKADDGGPRSDQRSLLIVFDATGSMAGDLAQLRAGAIEIVNELSEKENNPVFNYILSVFRDPGKFYQSFIRFMNLKFFYRHFYSQTTKCLL